MDSAAYKKVLISRLYSEKAELQWRYNKFSRVLSIPGVDVNDTKSRLEAISNKMAEVERQLDVLESKPSDRCCMCNEELNTRGEAFCSLCESEKRWAS